MKAVFKPLSGPKSHFDDRVQMGSRKDVTEIAPCNPGKFHGHPPKNAKNDSLETGFSLKTHHGPPLETQWFPHDPKKRNLYHLEVNVCQVDFQSHPVAIFAQLFSLWQVLSFQK